MRVKKLMSSKVWSCATTDSLRTAMGIMLEHDIGALPVVDNAGLIVGIVTDRDIALAAYRDGNPLDDIEVANAMSVDVHVCRPEDTVQAAEDLMATWRIRRLPVVDHMGRLVGMLSLNDIARASTRGVDGVVTTHVERTLSAICEPAHLHH